MAAGPAQCSRKGPGLGEEGEEGKGREGAGGGGTTRRSRHGGAGRRRAGGGRPAAAALHRGGDAEAALPAAGAPDDRAVLGEVHGQAGAEAGQPCRDVLRQLRGALHRHQPVHPQPAGADAEVQVGLLGEPVRLSAARRAPCGSTLRAGRPQRAQVTSGGFRRSSWERCSRMRARHRYARCSSARRRAAPVPGRREGSSHRDADAAHEVRAVGTPRRRGGDAHPRAVPSAEGNLTAGRGEPATAALNGAAPALVAQDSASSLGANEPRASHGRTLRLEGEQQDCTSTDTPSPESFLGVGNTPGSDTTGKHFKASAG